MLPKFKEFSVHCIKTEPKTGPGWRGSKCQEVKKQLLPYKPQQQGCPSKMGREKVPHSASVFLFQDKDMLFALVSTSSADHGLGLVNTHGWEGGCWWAARSGSKNPALNPIAPSPPAQWGPLARTQQRLQAWFPKEGDILQPPTPAWNPGARKQTPCPEDSQVVPWTWGADTVCPSCV